MNNNTIVTEIAPTVQELFDHIEKTEPGLVPVLLPGHAFYTPIEDVRVRRASELKNPDGIDIDNIHWDVAVFDSTGDQRRLVDFPDGWWEEVTVGIGLIRNVEHGVARLPGNYLLVSKGQSIVTAIRVVDDERTFEFTSASRVRESFLEEKDRYLATHPYLVEERPHWADTSSVVEFDDDEVTVTHSRAFGLVTIECSPTYVNGVLTHPDAPTLLLPNKFHESTANPDLMLEVACDLAAAADVLDSTQSKSIEVTRPEWVTDIAAQEEDGHVIRSVTQHAGIFETQVVHSQLLTSSGFKDYGVDATISWESTDIDGRSEVEDFTIKLHDISGLIQALQIAKRAV